MNQQDEGLSVRAWIRIAVAVAAAVLLIIFVVLNAATVEVDFLIGSVRTRLVWALLLSAALGFILGLLLPRLRRRDG